MTTITIDSGLLEQALDALNCCYSEKYDGAKFHGAKAALRAALAAQPSEPPDKCGNTPYDEGPPTTAENEPQSSGPAWHDAPTTPTSSDNSNRTTQQPAPAWHDAPTTPGVWVCDEGDICYTWTAHNIEILDIEPEDEVRWFGPIKEDTK